MLQRCVIREDGAAVPGTETAQGLLNLLPHLTPHCIAFSWIKKWPHGAELSRPRGLHRLYPPHTADKLGFYRETDWILWEGEEKETSAVCRSNTYVIGRLNKPLPLPLPCHQLVAGQQGLCMTCSCLNSPLRWASYHPHFADKKK